MVFQLIHRKVSARKRCIVKLSERILIGNIVGKELKGIVIKERRRQCVYTLARDNWFPRGAVGVSSWRTNDGAPSGRETHKKLDTAGNKQFWDAQLVFQLTDSSPVHVEHYTPTTRPQHEPSARKSQTTRRNVWPEIGRRYCSRVYLFYSKSLI